MSDVQHLKDEEHVHKHDLGDGKAAYRTILIVAGVLGVITVAEIFLAEMTNGSAVIMFILGFLKAALVVWFFMHVYRLWRGDAH